MKPAVIVGVVGEDFIWRDLGFVDFHDHTVKVFRGRAVFSWENDKFMNAAWQQIEIVAKFHCDFF